MKKRVFVIDVDRKVLDSIGQIFGDMGYGVSCYSNPLDGESIVTGDDFDLGLIDMNMPERTGLEIAENLLK